MNDAQIQLQNALTTTFLANLSFLSIYDKELYYRVDELSRMIEDGRYSEKYVLDFIEENGEFDIYDTVNDKYLYDRKPKKKKNDLINANSEISFFNTRLFDNQSDFDDEGLLDNLQDGATATKLFRRDFKEYKELLKINPITDKKDFDKVDKFLFIGTLCGRHIPKIVKNVDASMYFICEANLEIFRLSLFTVDYTVLTQKKGAIFSIMDKENIFLQKLNNFFANDPFSNHKLKYSTTNINVNTYFETIFSSIVRQDPMIFNHYMMQDCIMRNFANRVSSNKILTFANIDEYSQSLKDLPVLYVCAGPSLSENIDWIKKNKDKFIIVSIGASYQKLYDNGIFSDMIVTLDSQRLLIDNQFNKDSLYKMNNTIILASTMTDAFVLSQFDKKKLFLYEVLYPFLDNKIFSAFSVGEMGLSILVALNFKNIYMIGTDLALNQDTGHTHIEEHTMGNKNIDIKNISASTSMNKGTFGFRGDLIKVKGNLQNDVITNRLFESSIHCYQNNIRNIKKKSQIIYNLSTHGAFIENTVPSFPEDINLNNYSMLSNKDQIKEKLFFELNVFSATSFTAKELNKITKEIEYIEDIILYIKELDEKKYKSYTELYEDFSIIVEKLLRSNGIVGFGTEIFSKYFTLVLPYLNYAFNNKKRIKGLSLKLDKLKSIFYRQVITFISRYNIYLKRMILDNKKG